MVDSKRMLSILALTSLLLVSTMISQKGGADPDDGFSSLAPIDDPEMHPLGFFRGILPNPYPGQDLQEVYVNASMHSQFVPVWGRPSPFYNLSADLNGIWGEFFVDDLIRGNGMFPLVHMSFFVNDTELSSPPDISDPSLNDPAWRALYKQSALDIVNASRPAYISLGNEVNRWFEHHGDDPADDNAFRHFLSLYNETYDAVKQISPRTEVFCTFAREMVKENQESDMSVLERFGPDRLDIVVMTTYPYSVQGINNVSDIDDDYYSSVLQYTGPKKIGFSEAAWPSLSAFGGEEGQVEFIDNLTGRLTDGLDLHLLGWPWLHDIGPTDATGLRYNDGREKASLEKWRMNKEPVYNRSARVIDILEDSGTTYYDLHRTFHDPDPWDDLSFAIWNGTDYVNSSEKNQITAGIDDHFLVITTKENQTGNVQLRVEAEDMAGETNWTILLIRIEEINDPPALIDPGIKLMINEGTTSYIELSKIITDAEDPVWALDINITDSPHISYDLGTYPTPFMYIHPNDPDWFGSTYISMNVTDTDGAFSHLTIDLEYLPVDDPPRLNITDKLYMKEDTSMEVNVSGWWMDPDPYDEIAISMDAGDDPRVCLKLKGHILNITPVEDYFGTIFFHIHVTDGKFNVTGSVELIVLPVNDAPRSPFAGPGDPVARIRLTEDTEGYFDIDDLLSPYDPEGEVIIYLLKNGSEKIRTVSFEDNGTMRVVPFTDSNGEGSFRISLRDPSGGETEIDIFFEISPVNDPPLFIVPQNWSVSLRRGDHYEIDLSGYPYIAEDIEEGLEDLELFISSDICKRDEDHIVIDIPLDADWAHRSVSFYLEDSNGSRSEERILTIYILDPLPADGKLSLSSLNIALDGDDLVIVASGMTFQQIWVVISPETGSPVSYRVPEDTPGSYYIRLENIIEPFPRSKFINVHLSNEMNGPNDSGFEAMRFEFETDPDGETGSPGDRFPFEAVSLTALVIMTVIVLAFLARRRKSSAFEE